MTFVKIGNVLVRIEAIVAIEHGQWDGDKQDWEAIIVMNGGARIYPGAVFVTDVAKMLETKQ